MLSYVSCNLCQCEIDWSTGKKIPRERILKLELQLDENERKFLCSVGSHVAIGNTWPLSLNCG